MYDTAEKKAAFHAEAEKSMGKPTKKQKRLRGRPPKLKQPTEEQRELICRWWHEPMASGDLMKASDVYANASGLLGREVKRHQIKHWCGDKRGEPK